MLRLFAGKAPQRADKLWVGSYLSCKMAALLVQSRVRKTVIISQFGSEFMITLPEAQEGGSALWDQDVEGSSAGEAVTAKGSISALWQS